MWDNITDKLPIQVASHLNNVDEDDLFDTLIGGSHYLCNMERNIIDSFIIIIANSIIDFFSIGNSMVSSAIWEKHARVSF